MAIAVPGFTRGFVNGGQTFSLAAPASLGTADLDLVVGGYTDSVAAATVAISNDGTAFTDVARADMDTGSNKLADLLIGRKTGAASPGSVNFTTDHGYTQVGVGLRFRVTDVDLAAPMVVAAALNRASITGNPTNPTVTAPSITTVNAGDYAIAVFLIRARTDGADEDSMFGGAAGWTFLGGVQRYYGSPTLTLGVFGKPMPVAGATGALATTFINAGSDSDYAYMTAMFALKAGSGGGGGGPTPVPNLMRLAGAGI